MARSSGKAYANTHAVATQLLEEHVLTKETIGHSHHCKLNLYNDKTLLYLSLLETIKRDELILQDPTIRELLLRIDNASAQLGVLLAWHRGTHTLLITSSHQTSERASELLKFSCTVLPLAAYLHDHELRSTVSGSGTLLFGHALYASLLREVRR